MREHTARPWATWLVSVPMICGSCTTTVDPRPDFDAARDTIRASTGRVALYEPGAPLLTDDEIAAVLADGLTLDEALRLALLNNRRLQAGFMSLGVGRAELVQAGLLRNPSLGLSFLFPTSGGSPKIAADLSQSVVELWQLPARKDVARRNLDARVLEVSRFAGELLADTQDAYFESVAANETRRVAAEGAVVANRLLESMQRLVSAGVATRTDAYLAESRKLAADLAAQHSERAVVSASRRLAALLSFKNDLAPVELTDPLPMPVATELDREALVERSRDVRLDVRAAHAAVAAAAAQLELERKRGLTGAALGPGVERPEGGGFLAGVGGSIDLPIFDGNQAQVARAEYQLAQVSNEHDALVAEAGQEVRAAVDRVALATRTAQFVTTELAPQAQRAAELARSAHESGNTTLLVMLESQASELQARQSLVDVLLESAQARIDLERRAGAPWSVLARGWSQVSGP